MLGQGSKLCLGFSRTSMQVGPWVVRLWSRIPSRARLSCPRSGTWAETRRADRFSSTGRPAKSDGRHRSSPRWVRSRRASRVRRRRSRGRRWWRPGWRPMWTCWMRCTSTGTSMAAQRRSLAPSPTSPSCRSGPTPSPSPSAIGARRGAAAAAPTGTRRSRAGTPRRRASARCPRSATEWTTSGPNRCCRGCRARRQASPAGLHTESRAARS
mmetsp:Transcript_171174/g.548694  ORF Transcript_171174/g.548694 Transcript_171174/m.548694 type:complete len:212 (-) Transcript_171174:1498-2133(-)